MTNFSKLMCLIVSCISILFIAKFLETGICIKGVKEARTEQAESSRKTNIQAAKSVTILRQEHAKAVNKLQAQIDALRVRLDVAESFKSPCEVQGFAIIPE